MVPEQNWVENIILSFCLDLNNVLYLFPYQICYLECLSTSIEDILTEITAICVWLVKSIICLNYKQNLLVKLTFDIYSKDMLSETF